MKGLRHAHLAGDTGALCVAPGCNTPVIRTGLNGQTPRFCPDCQDKQRVQGYARKTCQRCRAKLREPSVSGLCGLCEEEKALTA